VTNLFDYTQNRIERSLEQSVKTGKDAFFLEPQIFSVSEFYQYINELLGFEEVLVKGEISELKVAKGYLIYFTIKDDQSALPCLMYKNKLESAGLSLDALEVGMSISVFGIANVYARRGDFKLVAEKIVLVGEGALKRAFELLRKKLEQEGLFRSDAKRVIPQYPERIGLITSQGAAAYTDFIKVARARWGGMKVYFYPSSVQGESAVSEILDAFHYFNAHLSLDAILLTRGGGSLEDLAAFNSEAVARAIRESKWPVICAVGHERDESLADFAADLRASTPSNAAELLTPTRQEEQSFLNSLQKKITLYMEGSIAKEKQYFERALTMMERFFQKPKTELAAFVSRFDGAATTWLSRIKQDLEQKARLLKSFDPVAVLTRGYSITTDENDRIIKSVDKITPKDKVKTLLQDGAFTSWIIEKL